MHWDAWINQKINRMEALEDGRILVELEDGRGAIFGSSCVYFVTKRWQGGILADTENRNNPFSIVSEGKAKNLYPANINGKQVLVSVPED